jgi:hypothetical protein
VAVNGRASPSKRMYQKPDEGQHAAAAVQAYRGNNLRGDSVSARRLGPATIPGRLSPSQRTRRESEVHAETGRTPVGRSRRRCPVCHEVDLMSRREAGTFWYYVTSKCIRSAGITGRSSDEHPASVL